MNTLFKILMDASENAFALTKVVIGQAINAAVNGIAVFGFRDSSGNATMPQLNDEGALPVVFDAGTTVVIPLTKKTQAEMETAGIDTRVLLDEISLLDGRIYTKPSMNVVASRATLFELVKVEDVGGTPTEESILVAYLEAGQTNFIAGLAQDKFSTDAAVNTKALRLYATMKDNKSGDVYGKASANLVSAN